MNAGTWSIQHPVGTTVDVELDDGSVLQTTTRSVAWTLGDGTAVVMVEGIRGGYRLSRVTPREKKASE